MRIVRYMRCVRVCVGSGLCILPMYSNILFQGGRILAFRKTKAEYSLNISGNRKKKYVLRKERKNFFSLRYLTNISKLWPFTSWQNVCVRVCVIVYILSYRCIRYMHSLNKNFRPSEMEQFRCTNTHTQNCL